jgi:MATE family multidrug resistance protein
MIVNSTAFAVGNGLCGALDTLLSQIFGANESDKRYGRETQRAMAMLALFALPLAVFYLNVGSLLNAIHQPEEIVVYTRQFVGLMTIGLVPIFALEVLKRFLQAQRLTSPIFAAVLASAALNPFLLEFFMFRMGLGFAGSPLAWAANLIITCAGLIFYLKRGVPHVLERVWGGWDREALHMWWPLLQLGLPSIGITFVEWSTFELNGVAASFTSDTDLAAYSICNQIATMGWGLHSGLSSATAIVVGNEIGALRPRHASMAAAGGMFVTCTVAVIMCCVFMAMRTHLASPFTSDAAVQERVAELAPFMACYFFFDSPVSVVNGIARGIGHQKMIAKVTTICMALIGVPLGLLMTFRTECGVGCLMLGPSIGISISLMIFARFFRNLNWEEIKAVEEDAAVPGGKDGPEQPHRDSSAASIVGRNISPLHTSARD